MSKPSHTTPSISCLVDESEFCVSDPMTSKDGKANKREGHRLVSIFDLMTKSASSRLLDVCHCYTCRHGEVRGT